MIDPIDGTKNFVRGVPVWATLIALVVDDEVVLGVVSAPALQRRWWASKGAGAFTGRSLLKATRCTVSDVRRLEDASLAYASLHGWDERDRLQDFLSLMRSGIPSHANENWQALRMFWFWNTTPQIVLG